MEKQQCRRFIIDLIFFNELICQPPTVISGRSWWYYAKFSEFVGNNISAVELESKKFVLEHNKKLIV